MRTLLVNSRIFLFLPILPLCSQYYFSAHSTTEWGPIGAALVLATFPTLFIYIFLSKKIQDSFVAGAIKG